MDINDDGGTPGSGSGDSAPPRNLVIRPAGSRAILIELAGMDEVLALKAALTEHPLAGQVDVLAAAETVMVTADSSAAASSIAQSIQHLDLSGPAALEDTLRVIETVYDGEDLDAVAELTGLSREGVVEAHTAQTWTAAFGGFAPGFAYLVGENQRLEVPRRESPRTAVPAGSVGLAGNFSAVYPRQSPGGWQLIGRTAAPMWDLDRERPALVVPGNRVQYKAVRELVPTQVGTDTDDDGPGSTGSGVTVDSPGAQSLIQDLGRYGYADLGVSEAGALDHSAMRSANRIAGNPANTAVVETAMGGLTLTAHGDQVVAVAGAPAALTVRGARGVCGVRGARGVCHPAMATAFALLDGEKLTLGAPVRGLRSYVAFRGGIDVPEVLGSRATDTMSGIGPDPLTAESFIPIAAAPPHSVTGLPDVSAGDDLPEANATVELTIVPGPRDDWFDQSAIDSLTGQEWEVTPQSNRVGIRLDGTALQRSRSGELPSEGTVAGSIQIPPSGMPVLFLADHPVTGGYPVIGVITHADLDKAAQTAPGHRIRFRPIDSPAGTDSQLGPHGPAGPDPLQEPTHRDRRNEAMQKVLIANRGEIAVRVERACLDAGLTSVAVYADDDAGALHVDLADEAYSLDGSTPAETYLNIEKLLDIASHCGADAIHPGYGFLSENADFARAVIDAGLTWIGPDPDTILALGNKLTAREIAVQANAPMVAGSDGPVDSAKEVRAFVDQHGLPIALKAAFGGGGRGLRVVRESSEIEEAFDSVRREAKAAFGRDECFIEQFLDKPRHVEAQVLADKHGTVVVVGTRDCSLQRRHQKLVEEAPAPFLTDEQRHRIHASAKAICRQADYTGAGTVEFLLGEDGTVSFLEVNTRLQVEHPVTEETSGVDLVLEQFRIADGEPLTITEDPEPSGHAIEFRINAEDVGRGFLPSPGTVSTFTPPAGHGIRVDTGVRSGDTIAGQFDSLLAKLIVTGADRPQAIRRARQALAEMEVTGLATVIPFHRAVLAEPAFTGTDSLGVYTGWIESEFAERIPADPDYSPEASGSGRRAFNIDVDGRRMRLGLPEALLAGLGAAAGASATGTSDGGAEASGAEAGRELRSPMAGNVVKWLAEEGSDVSEGDPVVVLEAMKMESTIPAHRAGTVGEPQHGAGDSVESGAVLTVIE